jgi:hypothetical protein
LSFSISGSNVPELKRSIKIRSNADLLKDTRPVTGKIKSEPPIENVLPGKIMLL